MPLFVELSTSDRFSSGGKKAVSCCGSQTSDGETVIKTPITETQIDFFFIIYLKVLSTPITYCIESKMKNPLY